MLTSLHIKDFAIIDELTVDFGPGLNVMTGETGAGKTIIVQAINLVLGARAQTDLVRAGSDRASVTAVFDASRVPSDIKDELKDSGVECDDELIVHRVVSTGGKGKISINGVPMTGANLKDISERLVDVSSQHEHQRLLDRGEHVNVVDSFGDYEGVLADYGKAHEGYTRLAKEMVELENNERAAKEKLEFLKFQLNELKAADMKSGEDEELQSRRSRLKHAVVLEEKTRAAEGALYRNSGSAVEALDHVIQQISECSQYDSSTSKWCEGLERARGEIEEVARELSNYADGLESDPESLEAMEERLHLIRRLIRKHGGTVEACLQRFEELKSEIDTIENYDDVLAEKKVQLESVSKDRRQIAGRLTEARRKAAKAIGKAIAKNLSDLGMAKTQFKVAIEKMDEGKWDETGPDSVEFLIAPNVGEPLLPLVKIASGGELSRVMLALKGALSDRARIAGTSIFDEVDSGIGGAIAEVVGKKLKGVSNSRQVICITHLPQVAVYGDNHIRISKHLKNGRTVTKLEALSESPRVDEIARMLGGEKITKATLVHAEEMLSYAAHSG